MGGFGKQKQRSNAISPQVESSLITGPTLKSLLNLNLWFKIQQKQMICLLVNLFVRLSGLLTSKKMPFFVNLFN